MTRVFIRNFGLQENLSDLVVIRQKRVQTYHNYILVGNKLKYKGTREGGKSKTNIYIYKYICCHVLGKPTCLAPSQDENTANMFFFSTSIVKYAWELHS